MTGPRERHDNASERAAESPQEATLKSNRLSGKAKSKSPASDVVVSLHRPNGRSFPIVGIGASAGGLEAFTQLLGHLPRKSGMAFVLVQHLAPRHESALTELLSRATQIPVTEVKDGMAVEPDRVYVIPPNVNMGILNGHLHLMARTPSQHHLPIDFFLRSLAEERGNKAIGVILSGTASDGTMGMKAIKAEGGITFAQDSASAKYGDMPRNAIATGCVDFVLPPDQIAQELVQIARHPYLRQAHELERPGLSGEGEDELRKIFVLLRTATGVDFSDYKHTTIKRRIKRRMVVHKVQNLKDYIIRLQESRPELDALYQDILIHVTGFFRDPEVFQALKTQVFSSLLKNRPSGNPIRIWVPGCSTGEEVYSIAICLLEFLGDSADSSLEIQIFATDISEVALERARAGVYLENITAEVSSERLRRFFVKTTRGYQVDKAIRDVCVFARQDINKDPPFSRLDLISCRNLLIYFGSGLQKKVLPIFHYALKPTGYLLLGNSETIGGFADLFLLVDKKHKIYSRKPLPARLALDFPRGEFAIERATREKKPEDMGSHFDIQKEADRILLSRYVPAGVVVNGDLEILQFRGRTGPFLEHAPGQPSLNLPKMAREGLLVDLRAAIQKARKDDAPVKKERVQIRHDGHFTEANIEVLPIKGPSLAERYFLVMFEEVVTAKAEPKRKSKGEPTQRLSEQRAHVKEVGQLKEELTQSKSTLQSVIEEQETTNEELKSANEEILSANEELQSTNEELETAKEELQSTNEELNTLNEELQNRNLELSTANNDLLNLLASASIPILMLGDDLRIRHFTPPAEKLLNLIPSDVGRPISDIKSNLIVTNLEQSISDAIDTMSGKESELQDNQGRWYSMRIRPYKTLENKLDGAVITWIDITTLKASLEGTEKALGEVAERYRVLFERNLAGVFRATIDGSFLECNSAFARIFGYESPSEIMGLKISDLFCSKANLTDIIKRLKAGNGPVNVEARMCRSDGVNVFALVSAALIGGERKSDAEVDGIVLDITERVVAEKNLSRLSSQLLQSQEEERKRMSRELHDTAASSLTAVVANLALLSKSDGSLNKKARQALAESLELAKKCLDEIRTISYLLHPPLLDELGLAAALRGYVDGFAKRSGIQVDLVLPPELGRLSKDVEIALFRIVQECLTNIHLHSGSPTARIQVTLADKGVALKVSDEGKGMHGIHLKGTPDQDGKVRLGVGIPGMRERVAQLGGRFEISSGKKGTTITAVLPLRQAAGESELTLQTEQRGV